jgi:hypothetical protein
METVFLSYTYQPHPDHKAALEQLHRYVIRAIEAMGLRVVDGVNVGGRPLDAALEQRIEGADALIALVTPQADDAGKVVEPAFVLDEFRHARGAKKRTMRVFHQLLPPPRGLGAGDEYTTFGLGTEAEAILKLINTIALWKQELGQSARVRIEPASVAAQYDEKKGDSCEFQVISPEGEFGEFRPAPLWPEPGAPYVRLTKLREGDRVRLRLKKRGNTWESPDAINPFIGGIRLEQLP